MDAPYDLTGRVAIVTGGGTGIGAATARLLAAHGADVAIAARTVADLERTAAAVRDATGRRCLPVPTNIKDEDQVIALVARTVDELGRVDILVNNAGGTRMGPLRTLPTKGWDASFDLNVRSAYFCTREAGHHFLAQGSGVIVNVSSDAGVYGVKGGAHYASAKAALQMLTKVAAAEWGPHGVRINCVAVGGVASERASAAWEVAGIDPGDIAAGVPLGRVGRPDEVAQAIVFFASDAASYITGQTLSVDGGPHIGGIDTA
ncbi:glucose 1-dehydrogenase [Frankia sp. AgB1.9]|uniref:SDR family NAD(P)-dependent oxidoreductase n=1 Tax=unclassified Frankia TaxID=2632575 RepID=UPI0019339285|nr:MULTISPECIES: glucose 1-dehydrogenase [unclassified Frankia]MBL7494575.1 glucose 1-dehydrogenase [Frankia sp. AgW1.1]MBL7550801.1 glucose 1-dehydrogenase [Frankia sp. AgB1.9]MBL7625531.1 glucose 1-dehydrogenase [Frankia sp. AgB1.8]